ncbi:MAG: hypothetical protein D8B41_03820 [Porphyromonas sp.]|nr:MAG: hypothetical protein D8B41_03820 [Porphyromonas sp.]
MQINTKVTNKILMVLAVLIIVATVVSFFFLNEAQRIVVLIGAALGIINLLGLGYFFNKNAGRRIR